MRQNNLNLSRCAIMLCTLLLTAAILAEASECGEIVWCDDFEGYSVGSFPSPPWFRSGNNSGAYIDDAVSYSGDKSMHLYGVVGSCWRFRQ
jgi:hypothetical protein